MKDKEQREGPGACTPAHSRPEYLRLRRKKKNVTETAEKTPKKILGGKERDWWGEKISGGSKSNLRSDLPSGGKKTGGVKR